jgi:hypothetical protein
MAAPSVHYGDRVITIPEQFDNLNKKFDKLSSRVNLLTIAIAIHLLGFDLTVGASIFKFLGL